MIFFCTGGGQDQDIITISGTLVMTSCFPTLITSYKERICSGGNHKRGIRALISLLQEAFIEGRDEY